MMTVTCVCGRVYRNITLLPVHCGCGSSTGQGDPASAPPAPKPPRTFGSIIRELAGCGCTSLPWSSWDRRGLDWCRASADQITARLASEPRTGLDLERASELVQLALQIADRSSSRS